MNRRSFSIGILSALLWCGSAAAADSGIVVANTGGKGTALFNQWQDFRHAIDEKSKGGFALDYLIFGEIGNSGAMLQAVENNKAQIADLNCQGIVGEIPELGVTELPYIFSSMEEADYVFDKNLTPLYARILDQHGLVLLQWQDMGWLDIYAKTPLEGPTALAGHDVRALSNPVTYAYLQSLGANPVPVTLDNLASPSQADKIFASLGNVTFFALKAQSVFKYYIKNHMSFTCGLVVANKTWFTALDPAEQTLLRGAFNSRTSARRAMETSDAKMFQHIAEQGTVVMEPSAEQKNAWAAAGLPLYQTILAALGGSSPEIYQALQLGKKEFIRQPDSQNPAVNRRL